MPHLHCCSECRHEFQAYRARLGALEARIQELANARPLPAIPEEDLGLAVQLEYARAERELVRSGKTIETPARYRHSIERRLRREPGAVALVLAEHRAGLAAQAAERERRTSEASKRTAAADEARAFELAQARRRELRECFAAAGADERAAIVAERDARLAREGVTGHRANRRRDELLDEVLAERLGVEIGA